MSINKRIQEIRRDAGLTQKAFAKELNIDQSYVSQLEREKANPSHLLIGFICTQFNVNRDWLLYDQGEKYIRATTLADVQPISVEALRKLASLVSEDEGAESNSSDIRAWLLTNINHFRVLIRTLRLMIPLMSSHQAATPEEYQSALEVLDLETETELPIVRQTQHDRYTTLGQGRNPLFRLFDDPELTQDQARTILENMASGYERKTGKNLLHESDKRLEKTSEKISKTELLEFTGDTSGNLALLRTCISLLVEIQNLDPDKLSDVKSFLEGNHEASDLAITDEERQMIEALREIDPIRRRAVILSASIQLNEALNDREIKRDQRKKQLVQEAIKGLGKAIGET